MNRRYFIRVSSACLALPDLCRAAEKLSPKRLFAIHVPLGMMPQFFFPGKEKRSLALCPRPPRDGEVAGAVLRCFLRRDIERLIDTRPGLGRRFRRMETGQC